jgi:hypothetical protein
MTLVRIYNEKEQVGQKEIQMYSLKRKKGTEKYNAYAERDKGFKERPDVHWHKGRGTLRAMFYRDELPACERKRSRKFFALK